MTSITGKEDAIILVEEVCMPLANGVRRPPDGFDELDCVLAENTLCCLLEILKLDFLGLRAGRQLNVKASQTTTFPRDDQKVSCL